ncbi:MAG: DUF4194 domain-containing protein [Pirellulales bacterium]|nr:DUF4194 domain-containing protein [Pirellulales bacterium]
MSNIFDRMVFETEASQEPDEFSDKEHSLPAASDDRVPDDTPQTSSAVKKVTQELLKHGYLDEAQKRELFRLAIVHEREIVAALEPLDLGLRLDTHRGVAFLALAQSAYDNADDTAGWSHPLVRRQRLTLEQSLLVAILRQAFVIHEQESGVGQSAARIAVDDLLPQFLTYFQDSGSDAKNESRLLNLLDQLKPHGIVSEVDKKQEVTIRPLVAYLANPESLTALLKTLEEQRESTEAAEHES